MFIPSARGPQAAPPARARGWQVRRRGGPGAARSLSGRGVGASWSSPSVPRGPPPSRGRGMAAGPRAQPVAPVRGRAERAVPGRGALAAAGRAEHVLLVVVVRPDGVQDAAEALPAERAGGAHGGPLPDAGEAEGVQTGVHVRRVVQVAQADGARPGRRRLPLPPARGGRRGGAALLQSLGGTARHGLPETGPGPELLWRREAGSREGSERGQGGETGASRRVSLQAKESLLESDRAAPQLPSTPASHSVPPGRRNVPSTLLPPSQWDSAGTGYLQEASGTEEVAGSPQWCCGHCQGRAWVLLEAAHWAECANTGASGTRLLRGEHNTQPRGKRPHSDCQTSFGGLKTLSLSGPW
ncbi:uncharacterized protein LOC106629451 [Zonotrichia albicollis]|uniref:uncharacterized protein LOC106629451 n=1 Tax=Zonotrichia albicollis TaxID=44394 RepID=UPI003D80E98D